MIHYRYHMITTKIKNEDNIEYNSYGIQTLSDAPNKSSSLPVIPDVTLNRKNLSHFIHNCNRYHLHPIHVREALSDFLAAQ